MTHDEFNALPNNEQRILIAQDVIKQLKDSVWQATKGTYVRIVDHKFTEELEDITPEERKEKQFCDYIPNLARCEVCARGAIFLSSVKFGNAFTLNDVQGGAYIEIKYDSLSEKIHTVFGDDQYLIEAAFEGSDVNGDIAGLIDDREEYLEMLIIAFNYREAYADSKDRMIAIMENIIRNNGKFDIKQIKANAT